MSTRHASPNSPLRQNRFASSPALANEMLGNLVALRCETLTTRADRELVFWLQHIANTIGLEKFTAEFLARYTDRIGSRSMRKIGVTTARHYNAEQVRAVRKEMEHPGDYLLRGEFPKGFARWLQNAPIGSDGFPVCSDDDYFGYTKREVAAQMAKADGHPTSYPVSEFLENCTRAAIDKLGVDIKTICLDPSSPVVDAPWYFHELIICLREYQSAWTDEQCGKFRDGFAHTALSRAVWNEIEDVSEMGGVVLLHNSSGNGKSYAAQAFCAAQPGRARYCAAPATNLETDFWKGIADAVGSASGESYKCEQIRSRARKTLVGSGLVLVVDNAEWLFPVSDYRYSLPGRMNQVLELAETGVPIVMIAGSKLFDTFGLVEARTGWDRSKFVNQLGRVVELPAALQKEDVQAVAAALLPDGERAAQLKLADFMIVAQGYLHSGKAAAQRARRIAAQQKRDRVALADMVEAIETWMLPSLKDMNSALQRAASAAQGSKAKVRNWRPDTEAQVAAKQGRRNQIVTSSDLKRADRAGRPTEQPPPLAGR